MDRVVGPASARMATAGHAAYGQAERCSYVFELHAWHTQVRAEISYIMVKPDG